MAENWTEMQVIVRVLVFFSLEASLDMILSSEQIIKVLVANTRRQVFSHRGLINGRL